MRKSFLVVAALTASMGLGIGVAEASITSNFNSGNDGWQVGDATPIFTAPSTAANWNSGGYLETADVFGEVAFFAPGAYLGNKLSSYGGTISYDLGDTFNDGVTYANLILYGAGKAITIGSLPPATVGFTSFTFTLTEAGFFNYPGSGLVGGTPVSFADFQSVLANLDGLAIHADWVSGGDYTILDNVVMSGPAIGGVPEPATWAMMIFGFGLTGTVLRRRSAMHLAATA